MADQKSKILIIGGTGKIGKYIVEASAKANHPTFALVRESTSSDPVKAKLLDKFTNLGVTLLPGDLYKHESLVSAIKQVDVVISTISTRKVPDQTYIISAIKEVGNVKRFLPSEFGNDVDHVHAVDPAKGDQVSILGDGNVKAILNKEEDIATYTIRAVDDPRTLNKTLLIKPPKNIVTLNEFVALKEKKLGKSLHKTYVSEDQALKDIEAAPIPYNVGLAVNHSVFINGDQTNFELDPSKEVEASELYPDVNYTAIEELL